MRFLDTLLPARCLVCKARYEYGPHPLVELAWGQGLCPECASVRTPREHPNRCPTCSIPLPRFIGSCERCRREGFSFDRAVVLHRYEGVAARVVQELKFGGHRSLARVMGAAMAGVVDAVAPASGVLVAVPSRRATVRRRGFAGGELITREVGRLTRRPVVRALVLRGGRSQKSLSYAERRDNAYDSVRLRPGTPVPESVVLIDDVLTTGITADSCARRLLDAGARSVVVVAFAIEY